MTYKQKHLYKKLTIIFMTFAYLFVILFALSFMFAILNQSKFDNFNNHFVVFLLFVPAIIGCIFAVIGVHFSNKRYKLFNNIKEYRQRVLFHKVITLSMNGQITESANIYNTQVPKGRFKDFLYPFVINSLLHSTDKTELERGNTLITNILNDYNPNDIKL